ncbi:hypothetical protein GGR52DRAFT_394903 [Hypoxylon sp. FL1284]|nr:hypothetical protein GGR52DRAFT_394903 [Hypoxylon sp. FL1284]
MDPISAIASFIAIGQALAAAPKIIDALSSVIKVRQEVLDLLNEIEILHGLGRHIREAVANFPSDDTTGSFSTPKSRLIKSVEDDLVSTVAQLQELAQKCRRETKDVDQLKVNRLRWFLKRGKIADLSKRVKRNREHLQEILTCESSLTLASHTKMLVEIHAIVTTQGHTNYQPPLPLVGQGYDINKIKPCSADRNNWCTLDKTTDVSTSLIRLVTLHDDSRKLALSSIVEDPSERSFQSDEPLVQMMASIHRACPRMCPCQCHWLASRHRPHPAMSPICGWLGHVYNNVPRLDMRRYDTPSCQRAFSPIRINLCFPLLYCSRALEASLSIGAITSVGASLHLRVPRHISSRADIWHEIREGKIERVRLAVAQKSISHRRRWNCQRLICKLLNQTILQEQ